MFASRPNSGDMYGSTEAKQLHQAIRECILVSASDNQTVSTLRDLIKDLSEDSLIERNNNGQTQLLHALNIVFDHYRAWALILNLIIDGCCDRNLHHAINVFLLDGALAGRLIQVGNYYFFDRYTKAIDNCIDKKNITIEEHLGLLLKLEFLVSEIKINDYFKLYIENYIIEIRQRYNPFPSPRSSRNHRNDDARSLPISSSKANKRPKIHELVMRAQLPTGGGNDYRSTEAQQLHEQIKHYILKSGNSPSVPDLVEIIKNTPEASIIELNKNNQSHLTHALNIAIAASNTDPDRVRRSWAVVRELLTHGYGDRNPRIFIKHLLLENFNDRITLLGELFRIGCAQYFQHYISLVEDYLDDGNITIDEYLELLKRMKRLLPLLRCDDQLKSGIKQYVIETLEMHDQEISSGSSTSHSDTEFTEESIYESRKRKRSKPDKKTHDVSYVRNNSHFNMHRFSDKKQAAEAEVQWEKDTSMRFFRIGMELVSGKSSSNLYNQIAQQMGATNKAPISLNGICKRSLIVALSKVIYKNNGTPALQFQMGNTQIQLTPGVQDRQIGNCLMTVTGIDNICYGKACVNKIDEMLQLPLGKADTENSKYLARKNALLSLLKKRQGIISAFTPADFNYQGLIKIEGEFSIKKCDKNFQQAQIKANYLNGFIFLMTIVEVIVRLYRYKNGNHFYYEDKNARVSDDWPIAIAQARGLSLLLDGKISFDDFVGETAEYGAAAFEYRAKFGIATSKGTIHTPGVISEKLSSINESYNSFIVEKYTRLLGQNSLSSLSTSSNSSQLIGGRSRMYTDLKECYGSGSESGDESCGYSSSDGSCGYLSSEEDSAPVKKL